MQWWYSHCQEILGLNGMCCVISTPSVKMYPPVKYNFYCVKQSKPTVRCHTKLILKSKWMTYVSVYITKQGLQLFLIMCCVKILIQSFKWMYTLWGLKSIRENFATESRNWWYRLPAFQLTWRYTWQNSSTQHSWHTLRVKNIYSEGIISWILLFFLVPYWLCHPEKLCNISVPHFPHLQTGIIIVLLLWRFCEPKEGNIHTELVTDPGM